MIRTFRTMGPSPVMNARIVLVEPREASQLLESVSGTSYDAGQKIRNFAVALPENRLK